MYKDKVAFVTGGSRGIGFKLVERLLEQGAKVCFLSHYEETGKAAMEKLLAKNPNYPVMTAYPCIWDSEAVKAVADEVAAKWGTINAVFCNAGVDANKPVSRITDEEWDYVMNVNAKGTFATIKACLPYLKANNKATGHGGNIVCTSSVTGTQGSSMGLPYPTSKHAVVGIVRSLSMELSVFNISVTAVCPGVVDTDLVAGMPELAKKQVETTIPLGRFATTDDIAEAMLYLGSDGGFYATGAILEVTGGYKATVGKM